MISANSALDVTQDSLFGGKLRLKQFASGHRAGTDAVLLAAMTPPGARRIADLGAGSGIVGLRAAQINPEARITLVEREPELARLARDNIALNQFDSRVDILEADVLTLGRDAALRNMFDCVLTNPPYDEPGKGRASPDPLRARAHVMDGSLDGWLRAAAGILAPGGQLAMIHRVEPIGDIMAAMKGRFGGVSLRFVQPHSAAPAIRVLVTGIKGSRAKLRVLPAIVLNERDGGFTDVAARLHRGERSIGDEAGG